MAGNNPGTLVLSVAPLHDEAPKEITSISVPSGRRARQKRRRKELPGLAANEEPECLFEKLPHELLAEILIYTRSPQTALAVARCSKFLCMTMTNSSSAYIWRKTRQAALPPLPEPFNAFTESAYASFLFDSGLCEVSQVI